MTASSVVDDEEPVSDEAAESVPVTVALPASVTLDSRLSVCANASDAAAASSSILFIMLAVVIMQVRQGNGGCGNQAEDWRVVQGGEMDMNERTTNGQNEG